MEKLRDRDNGQFRLVSEFEPQGDQPKAIEKLVSGLEQKRRNQVLLGVTGSGKTFTMANVIARVNKPTLVIAHNKTLAAQLYNEFRELFPENAVAISSATTITISRKLMFRRPTPISRKTRRSTTRSTSCAMSATRALFERRDS